VPKVLAIEDITGPFAVISPSSRFRLSEVLEKFSDPAQAARTFARRHTPEAESKQSASFPAACPGACRGACPGPCRGARA